MSEVTINGGAAVLRACFYLPLAGVWSADLDADTDEDVTGAVTIEVDGAVAFRGTVIDGAVSHGQWKGRIVGGAGGLRETLPALAYLDATRADIVRDALAESGESIAPGGDLSAVVARYHRAEGAAARTIDATATALGYGWRVLDSGLVWLNVETWPDAPEADVTLVDTDPRERRYTLGGDVLAIRPGQLLQVRDEAADVFVRVGPVRLEIEGIGFTATVWRAP